MSVAGFRQGHCCRPNGWLLVSGWVTSIDAHSQCHRHFGPAANIAQHLFVIVVVDGCQCIVSCVDVLAPLLCPSPLDVWSGCSALNGGRAGLLISLFATRVLCITLYENVSGYGCSAGTIGTDVAGVVVTVGEDCDGWLG